MSSNLLPTSLRDKPQLAALDAMLEARINAIDLTPLLIYLIDIVPVGALPYLASQLDVLGFKGWALTSNEEEQRGLLKKAIELHRLSGTPYAIKEALKSIGYYDVKIQEGASFYYNGDYNYDGTIYYGGGSWANFTLQLIDLGETKGISSEGIADIVKMVEQYKRESANLIGILFYCTTIDYQDISEDMNFKMVMDKDVDEFNVTIYYNGVHQYDGSKNYTSDTSVFDLTLRLDKVEDNFNYIDDSNFEIKFFYV